jgi:hypothetical protein
MKLNYPKCNGKNTKRKQSVPKQLMILGFMLTIIGIPIAAIMASVGGYYVCKDCGYTWK